MMLSAWCFRKILTDSEVPRREGGGNRKMVPAGLLPSSYEFGGPQKYCVSFNFRNRDDFGIFEVHKIPWDIWDLN